MSVLLAFRGHMQVKDNRTAIVQQEARSPPRNRNGVTTGATDSPFEVSLSNPNV